MGKIPGLEYKSPNSTKLSDQVQRPAAAKALSTESTPKQVMPTDKVILLTDEPAPKAERLRKARAALESVATVSNAQPDAKPVSNGAARIARWRSKQDPEIRKQQNREAVQRSRAKRKAEKV